MENITKDPASLILLNKELKPKDVINLCSVNRNLRNICNNKDIWRQRFQIDFPYLVKYVDLNENPKNSYLEVFSKISKAHEEMTDKIFTMQYGVNYRDILKKKIVNVFSDYYYWFIVHILKIISRRISKNAIKNFEDLADIIRESVYSKEKSFIITGISQDYFYRGDFERDVLEIPEDILFKVSNDLFKLKYE